jgi:hypothetical protein
LETFLSTFRPSLGHRDIAWYSVRAKTTASDGDDVDDDEEGGTDRPSAAVAEWEALPFALQTAEQAERLARKHRILGGKWLLFTNTRAADEVWSRVANAVVHDALGQAAKISPAPSGSGQTHVICVYVRNSFDAAEVGRVRAGLRQLGFTTPLSFKPDIYTYLGVYARNPWNISPVLYRE